MVRRIALALLALIAMPLMGAEVYRSIDQNGNVRYSDRPEGALAERVVVAVQAPASRPAPRPTPAANNAAGTRETTTETPPERRRVEPTADERAENCTQARERVERYTVSHRLFRTLPNGEREYLDDAQIDEARARAAADVDNWCS